MFLSETSRITFSFPSYYLRMKKKKKVKYQLLSEEKYFNRGVLTKGKTPQRREKKSYDILCGNTIAKTANVI